MALAMTMVALVALAMVAAVGLVAVLERACKQLRDRFVGISLDSGIESDAAALECVPGAHSDAAAHQCVDAGRREQTGQGPMALSVGRDDGAGDDLAVLNLIYFEGFRVSEMLEDGTIVVCDRYSHVFAPPF